MCTVAQSYTKIIIFYLSFQLNNINYSHLQHSPNTLQLFSLTFLSPPPLSSSMERSKMDSVDDFSEDLDAKMVRLSSTTVGFGAEMVHGWFQCRNGCCSSSLTSTSPLGRGCASASWIEVAFCGLACLLVDWSGYRSWLCLLVDRSGFRCTGGVGFGVSAWWVSILGCQIFGLLWVCFVMAVFVLFYCRRCIILLC